MTARDRYVAGGWLLIVSVTLLCAGRFAWSRFDVQRTNITRSPGACLIVSVESGENRPPGSGHAQVVFGSGPTVDSCVGSTVTTITRQTRPSHVPGFTLILLGSLLGVAGVFLLRTQPADAREVA